MANPKQPVPRSDKPSGAPERRALRGEKAAPGSTPERAKGDASGKTKRQDGTRETVESIVIAFILAFLFRTFEAEAFVIPTGSMAPTLYGRHIDVECPQCGYAYRIGASDEVDDDGYFIGKTVETALCPNCRFETRVKHLASGVEYLPVFKGDRILVNKFPYEFGEPRRWDVVVFQFPESPTKNYIKRVVGLPGETIAIRQGDVYVKTADDPVWRIARKEDPDKQRELQILVYDDRYPEKLLHEHAWPERWAAVKRGDPAGIAGWIDDEDGWKRDPATRSFQLPVEALAGDEPRWIRYRNIVPDPEDWLEALAADKEKRAARFDPLRRLELVSDFAGYNAYSVRPREHDSDVRRGLYWVGDLTLSCRVAIGAARAQNEGRLIFELTEGDRWYRATIDPGTGRAALSYLAEESRREQTLATADTKIRIGGTYHITFANVDDRLNLWIDGKLVEFDAGTEYPPLGGMGGLQAPTRADLAPAGIASFGVEATVSELLLERDIYYRGDMLHPHDQHRRDDVHPHPRQIPEYGANGVSPQRLSSLLSNPDAWFEEYAQNRAAALYGRRGDAPEETAEVAFEFPLGEDEFLMLGDNSPKSKDSRLWANSRRAEHRHAVPRSALVGKAFFIYWPHGQPFGNEGRGYPDGRNSWLNNDLTRNWFYHQKRSFEWVDRGGHRMQELTITTTDYPAVRVPFYPQVGRMKRIR